jgi:hypothetical protein
LDQRRSEAEFHDEGHQYPAKGPSQQWACVSNRFSSAEVDVTLTFTTPALPDDLMLLSRPTTYVTCDVKSNDSRTHNVEFYFDARGELASNSPDQLVITSIYAAHTSAVRVHQHDDWARNAGNSGACIAQRIGPSILHSHLATQQL